MIPLEIHKSDDDNDDGDEDNSNNDKVDDSVDVDPNYSLIYTSKLL